MHRFNMICPNICYAHLAATQLGQFMKFEDKSETSSSHGGLSAAGAVPVPQLPKLQESLDKLLKEHQIILEESIIVIQTVHLQGV
ncbi:unnamed protein product [Lathyrus sativus]|nr:unnamed protein product [Lathyrus sativus]